MKGFCCVTIGLLCLTTAALAQAPIIDGTADAVYGSPVIVQDTQTQFGDAVQGTVDYASGSELDNCYAYISDCTLYVVLAGNLESNFNKLEIFFDTKTGGDNRLLSGYPMSGLTRMGESPAGAGNGLTFDTGFEPDYWIAVTCGGTPFALYVDYSEVKVGGNGYYVGTGTAVNIGGALTGGTNPYGIACTLNNSNIAGVTGGTGLDFGGGTVTTGVELAIPLGAIGVPTGDIMISTFVNGVNHDYASNQVLGGIGSGSNFGEPRNINFNNVSGNQYFLVANASACGACCVGTTCSITDLAGCGTAGGSFIGAGVPCLSGTCTGIAKGACCVSGTCVADQTPAECAAQSGEYLGDDSLCNATVCNLGACCVGQTCSVIRAANCALASGTYYGDGTTCDPNPCTLGACCFGPSCAETSPAICASQNGVYKGDGITCASNPCNAPDGTPIIDGQRDASYGTALSVQDTQTGFADSSEGFIDFDTTGSELDAAYAKVVGDRLFLFLAGNLQSNANKLELFFDTRTGGQNQLRNDNPELDFNGLNRMGADTVDPITYPGLQFDTAFEADFYMNICNTQEPGTTVALYLNHAELRIDPNTQGFGYYGQGRAANYTNGGMLQYGGTNPYGVLVTLDNSNVAGVIGGYDLITAPPEYPADVTTGIELSIPLSALGSPTGSLKACAFINSAGHDSMSNQVLGPIAATGSANLGEPRVVSFVDPVKAIPGNQYFVIPLPSAYCRGDASCDGLISYADINPFVQAISNLSAWQAAHPTCAWQNCDVNEDGVVSYADINPFVQKVGSPGPCP